MPGRLWVQQGDPAAGSAARGVPASLHTELLTCVMCSAQEPVMLTCSRARLHLIQARLSPFFSRFFSWMDAAIFNGSSAPFALLLFLLLCLQYLCCFLCKGDTPDSSSVFLCTGTSIMA